MNETPITPPSALGPMTQVPTDPPTMAVIGAVPAVTDAVQAVIDSVYADLSAPAEVIGSICHELCLDLRDNLDRVRELYEELADKVCLQITSRVLYAANIVDGIIDTSTDYQSIQQAAVQLPLPLSPVYGLPAPPGRWQPGVPPRVEVVPAPGGLLGVPQWPQAPTWVTVPFEGTVSVPTNGGGNVPWGTSPLTPQQTTTRPGGGTGPGGGTVPSSPTTPSPGSPTRPGRGGGTATGGGAGGGAAGGGGKTPTGGSGGGTRPQRPTVGGGVDNSTPPVIAPGSTQTPSNESDGDGSQVGQDGGGAAFPATPGARDCPPVTVIVQCAPGSQANVVPTPGVTGGVQYTSGSVPETAPPAVRPDTTPETDQVEQGPPLTEQPQYDRMRDRPAGPRVPRPTPYGPPAPAEDIGEPTGYRVDVRQPYRAADELKNYRWRDVFRSVNTLEGCLDWDRMNVLLGSADKDLWRSFFGDTEQGEFDFTSVLGRLGKDQSSFFKPVISFISGVAQEVAAGVQNLNGIVGGCDSPSFILLQGIRSFLGFVERWAGASFDEAQTKVEYLIGQQCAVQLPDANEIDTAYLVSQIGGAAWECWVKSLGYDAMPRMQTVLAKQARPGPMEALRVGRQMGLDETAAVNLMEHTGVKEDWLKSWYVELSKYIPGPGDLIRFMVRDVFDAGVVASYGYDEEFDNKWSGQALEWGRQQGLTEEQARYYWRAHWQLPSPTQAYEFLHRLRPGRVGADVETTDKDVERLLEIADIPGFWRKRLMEVSYHPLTRVDARRAYFLGSLTYEQTYEAIKDLGYNSRDAKYLLDYWTYERVRWLTNQPWARAFARGTMTDDEFRERLSRLQLTPNIQDQVEQELELQQDEVLRRQTISALRTGVIRGLMSDDDARNTLIGMGYRRARAAKMVQAWEAARAARGRQLAAQQLCNMHDRGLIDTEDYADALSRQGYSPGDVKNIISLCRTDKAEAAARKGRTAIQHQIADAAREVNSARRERQREAMERARAVRALNARTRDEERVQKRLAEAMARIAKAQGGLPSEYRAGVERWFNILHVEKGFTRQGAAEFAKEIAGQVAQTAGEGWSAAGRSIAAAVPSVKPEALPAEVEPVEQLPPPEVG